METLFTNYGDRTESLGLTATLILDAVQIWGACCGNSTVSDWGDLEVATFWANFTNVRKLLFIEEICRIMPGSSHWLIC